MQAVCCSSRCSASGRGPALASKSQTRSAARQQVQALEAYSRTCAEGEGSAAPGQLPSPAALPRRAVLASAVAAAAAPWLFTGAALADNDAVKAGLSKYVKKKKLERIETYIPPLLEARAQLVRVGRVMLQDPSAARQLLRQGVFAGLRDNVRSVGEYASQRSGDASGTELVRGFFAELEGLDAALRQAMRGSEGLPDDARARLDGTIAALDRLLASVPSDVMEQAQQVVDTIRRLDEEAVEEAGQAAQALDKLL